MKPAHHSQHIVCETELDISVPEGRLVVVRHMEPATSRSRYWLERQTGRAALARACRHLGLELSEVPRRGKGPPVLPEGHVASVSHKRASAPEPSPALERGRGRSGATREDPAPSSTLARGAALASRGEAGVGVDLEILGPAMPGVARRIRHAGEPAEGEPWHDVLLRFSLKEAAFKAMFTLSSPPQTLADIEVCPEPGGHAEVRFGKIRSRASYLWLPDDLGRPWLLTWLRL